MKNLEFISKRNQNSFLSLPVPADVLYAIGLRQYVKNLRMSSVIILP